jgi:hypothetical protein
MRFSLLRWGRISASAFCGLLLVPSLAAAENDGVRPVAETLVPRAAAPAAPSGGEDKSKLSDSAVRVLMTYAFSIIPDEIDGPDGKKIKVDRASPNAFMIPVEDARKVIRVATRSAYAEVCGLPELERANYLTLVKGEEDRKIWSDNQMIFIKALHMFSVSYFTGNIKIKEEPAEPDAADQAPPQAGPVQADLLDDPVTQEEEARAANPPAFSPKRPECSPDQKDKVTKAINAYVQSANAAPGDKAGAN